MISHKDLNTLMKEYTNLAWDRYEVIDAFHMDKDKPHRVIIQVSKTAPVHFCVQYRGGGKCFSAFKEVIDYISERRLIPMKL